MFRQISSSPNTQPIARSHAATAPIHTSAAMRCSPESSPLAVQPLRRLPAGLAGLPRGAAVRTKASARPDPANRPATLVAALAKSGLALETGHPGFGLTVTLELRKALDQLHDRPGEPLGSGIREACIDGSLPRFSAVMLLIGHGVMSPNVCFDHDVKGETLLHAIASESAESHDSTNYVRGYAPIAGRVRALVDSGANINSLCDSEQMTPLDYAELRGAAVVAEALRKYGGIANRTNS